MPRDSLQHLRAICLGLPEAGEQETWGHPTFRIRGKIFATAGASPEGTTVSCKAPPGMQEHLIASRRPTWGIGAGSAFASPARLTGKRSPTSSRTAIA